MGLNDGGSEESKGRRWNVSERDASQMTMQCQDREMLEDLNCVYVSGSDMGRAGFRSVWCQTPDTSITPVLPLHLSSVSMDKGLHNLEPSYPSEPRTDSVSYIGFCIR